MVHHGTESMSFLGPKIWKTLPDRLKNIDGLGAFKMEIKSWKPEKYLGRLCTIYIHNVDFI